MVVNCLKCGEKHNVEMKKAYYNFNYRDVFCDNCRTEITYRKEIFA
jgi:RNase P subunit RPR2